MKAQNRAAIVILALLSAISLLHLLIGNSSVELFSPAGPTAYQEIGLMGVMVSVMLLVALPLLALLFTFAITYRTGNKKAKRLPKNPARPEMTFVIWLIPIIIVTLFSLFIWKSSHVLAPEASIASSRPVIT